MIRKARREDMPERAQAAARPARSPTSHRFTQGLVEDLLEISRFDAGAVRLEVDDVAIVETVRMAVRTLSADPVQFETADDESNEGVAK